MDFTRQVSYNQHNQIQREEPSVAYLGPKASSTYQITRHHFPDSDFFLLPKPTIVDVFEAVHSGEVDRGVVPFENFSDGHITDTLDLLCDKEERFPDLYISGEASFKTDYCLLGYPSSTEQMTPPLSPTTSQENLPEDPHSPTLLQGLDHIKHVYSDPEALGRCEAFLKKHLPDATRHIVPSTIAAARLVAHDPYRNSAALGSSIAIKATQPTVTILAERVQDVEDHGTRFLIFKRVVPVWHYEPSWTEDACEAHGKNEGENSPQRKLLVSWTVRSKSPTSLADALAIFMRHRLSLSFISARPSKYAWDYRYFAEFEWRWDHDTKTCPVDAALRDLEVMAREWKCHGAWGTTMEW